jgi:SPW repeat
MEVGMMAETSTKVWTRWQDWAQVVLGAVAALSTIWVDTSTKTAWTMVVLGVLIAIDGLWSLAAPGTVASEGIEVVLGVLLFISPWVMGYTALTGASWFSWVIGVLTVVVGVTALPAANSAHTRLTGQH